MTETDFLPLFDSCHQAVYRLALSITRSPQDAEDIVQTAFLKLLSTKRPPAPGKEKAWLIQVALNASRDLLRTRHRQGWISLEESIPALPRESSLLYEAVTALPEKERIAVHLHYYEGYSCAEIAKLLRVTPSAISMRLHRARKQLVWPYLPRQSSTKRQMCSAWTIEHHYCLRKARHKQGLKIREQDRTSTLNANL